MCTVSYIFSNGKTIITSNRDEKTIRETLPPRKYTSEITSLYYPKDIKGGTWFVTKEDGTVLVLLNGAAEKHITKPSYRKSRGLIVIEIISANNPIAFWDTIDLIDIEPFTLVLFQENNLYQLRWDELKKSKVVLDPKKNYIWSSSTLYSKEIRNLRHHLFDEFLLLNNSPTSEQIIDFHGSKHYEDYENGLVINQLEELKTVSITQIVLGNNQKQILYKDLLQNNSYLENIS